MKNKLKNKLVKRILIVVLVIFLLFVLRKVYHFIIINKLYEAIEDFKEKDNRAYLVTTTMDGEAVIKEKILLKQETVKYINSKNNSDLNYIWKNFQNNEEYFIDVENKMYTDDIIFKNKNILPNLPNFIGYAFKKGRLNISKIFEIRNILLTKYNDKVSYKIITKNKIIIVDKDTCLPIYSSFQEIDTNGNKKIKIENTYEFKVGEVTDEDVALPDLSEYTVVE